MGEKARLAATALLLPAFSAGACSLWSQDRKGAQVQAADAKATVPKERPPQPPDGDEQ